MTAFARVGGARSRRARMPPRRAGARAEPETATSDSLAAELEGRPSAASSSSRATCSSRSRAGACVRLSARNRLHVARARGPCATSCSCAAGDVVGRAREGDGAHPAQARHPRARTDHGDTSGRLGRRARHHARPVDHLSGVRPRERRRRDVRGRLDVGTQPVRARTDRRGVLSPGRRRDLALGPLPRPQPGRNATPGRDGRRHRLGRHQQPRHHRAALLRRGHQAVVRGRMDRSTSVGGSTSWRAGRDFDRFAED